MSARIRSTFLAGRTPAEAADALVDLDTGLSYVANDPERPLGRVLAAVYDPALDALAVLDEVRSSASPAPAQGGGSSQLRLLHVVARTGES